MTRLDVQQVIEGIVEKLVVGYAPIKVILFGSHAWGDPGPDSDIDLLIIKETSERFIDRWASARKAIESAHCSLPVDTIVLTPEEIKKRLAIGDPFVRQMIEEGETLYAR